MTRLSSFLPSSLPSSFLPFIHSFNHFIQPSILSNHPFHLSIFHSYMKVGNNHSLLVFQLTDKIVSYIHSTICIMSSQQTILPSIYSSNYPFVHPSIHPKLQSSVVICLNLQPKKMLHIYRVSIC